VTGNIGEIVAEPLLRTTRASRDGGWAIQVGAFEREDDARQRLSVVRKKAADLLGDADPHTEKTTKGAKTYYRARFTGFDRAGAEAACKALQRADVACLALKI
jgi:D-alanyl-D-alanine carboxypeptidase